MKTTNEKITLRDKKSMSDGISYKATHRIPIMYTGMNMMYMLNSIFYTPFYRCVKGYEIKSASNSVYNKLNTKTLPICNMIEIWDIDKNSITNYLHRSKSISQKGTK